MSTTMAHWALKVWERCQPRRAGAQSKPERRSRARRLVCEGLEGRSLLTAASLDYTLMGGQWDNNNPITFSVAPDGAVWDRGTNNVNAVLNSQFGGTDWHQEIAIALQTWAASANLNFVPVTDGPYDFNVEGKTQGDSRFGDIRVAGYTFTTAPLAQTYGPPPNGWTAGGDVKLNTSNNFGPAGQYDLQTILTHEVGHSLGLGESPQPSAAMYAYYSGGPPRSQLLRCGRNSIALRTPSHRPVPVAGSGSFRCQRG